LASQEVARLEVSFHVIGNQEMVHMFKDYQVHPCLIRFEWFIAQVLGTYRWFGMQSTIPLTGADTHLS
jgi:hypothetical protein